jgi:DNA-binding NarL/FixJ family response regulator
MRAGMRMLIKVEPDMDVVGEAGDGHEAISMVRRLQPDVVTFDLQMPGGRPIKMIELLLRECNAVRVLVVTMHDDRAYLRSALAAGASGYLVKHAAPAELISAIRKVHAGELYVNLQSPEGHSETGTSTTARSGKAVAQPDALSQLTRRERQVLKLLGTGHGNNEAAERLDLSVKTIETYRTRIAKKLGLRSRADFVRFTFEFGLHELPDYEEEL